jgi:hypothetical protein
MVELPIMLRAILLIVSFTVSSAFLAPKHFALRRKTTKFGAFVTHFEELAVPTGRGVSMVDITKDIKDIVTKSGCKEGVATIISKHSTVLSTRLTMTTLCSRYNFQNLYSLLGFHYAQ